jgi:hypothetical protein
MLDAQLNFIDFNTVVQNGTSLVVHVTEPALDLYHLRYCTTLSVDRVIAIESAGLKLIHPEFAAHFDDIITLSDDDHEWLKPTISQIDTTQTITQLSESLRLQQLWVDGELMNQWHQPLDNHWKSFITHPTAKNRFRSQFGAEGIAWLRSQNPHDETVNFELHGRTHNRVDPAGGYKEFLKWYALVPNPQLQNILNGFN